MSIMDGRPIRELDRIETARGFVITSLLFRSGAAQRQHDHGEIGPLGELGRIKVRFHTESRPDQVSKCASIPYFGRPTHQSAL
jgi:hypothetical protein